jgi:DNA-binding response OmpR family regulator
VKARILVIEDVREMADLIGLYLGGEGMEVVSCQTGEEGLERFRSSRFDLVVLDINLPGMDGFEFLQHLRRESAVPVVIVSARDADEDMVLGLGIGADEFVTKPFSPKVLVARIRALLRRATELRSGNAVRFGEFVLEPDAYLAARPDRALSPDTIYADVWRQEFGDITAVAVYIQRLRRKIEDDPSHPRFLQTVTGKGYRFSPGGEP